MAVKYANPLRYAAPGPYARPIVEKEGGSFASVGAGSVGAGAKIAQGTSFARVRAHGIGSGRSIRAGASMRAVRASALSAGNKVATDASTVAIAVSVISDGQKSLGIGGSFSIVEVRTVGLGKRVIERKEGQSFAPVEVAGFGAGQKISEDQSMARMRSVGTQSDGTKTAIGKSHAQVEAEAAGDGERIAHGSGFTQMLIEGYGGEGIKYSRGGVLSRIVVATEQEGTKQVERSSMARAINVMAQGIGHKRTTGSAWSVVAVVRPGTGHKRALSGAAIARVLVDVSRRGRYPRSLNAPRLTRNTVMQSRIAYNAFFGERRGVAIRAGARMIRLRVRAFLLPRVKRDISVEFSAPRTDWEFASPREGLAIRLDGGRTQSNVAAARILSYPPLPPRTEYEVSAPRLSAGAVGAPRLRGVSLIAPPRMGARSIAAPTTTLAVRAPVVRLRIEDAYGVTRFVLAEPRISATVSGPRLEDRAAQAPRTVHQVSEPRR